MKKRILLTGATDGIGYELAKKLASEGHILLLHGRSEDKLCKLKDKLLGLHPKLKLEIFNADFSEVNETKIMAESIVKLEENIDVLINNAGIYVTNQPKNKEGFDIRFMVNTVSPYVLTKTLLPLLHEKSRVINVSSAAQMPVDLDKFQKKWAFSHDEAYAQSKLALIMWGMELANEVNSPQIIAVNPKSFLGSKMVKEAYGREGFDLKFGVDILYRASFSEEFANKTGVYYDNDNCCFANPHPFSQKETERKKLMSLLDD